jgi:hypothetical protein
MCLYLLLEIKLLKQISFQLSKSPRHIYTEKLRQVQLFGVSKSEKT